MQNVILTFCISISFKSFQLLLPEFPKSRSHEIILLSKDDPSSYIFERAKKDPRIAVMTRNWLFKNNLHFPTILSLTLEIIGDMVSFLLSFLLNNTYQDKISRYLWIDKAIKACQNDPKDTTALIEKCLIRYIENLKVCLYLICAFLSRLYRARLKIFARFATSYYSTKLLIS